MIFQSKPAMTRACLKKFRRTELSCTVFVFIYIGFEIACVFQERDSTKSLLYTAFCTFILFLFLRFVYSRTILANKIIDRIQIDSGSLRIQTFSSSMLYIIRKEPMVLDMSSADIEVRSSDLKYGIDRKWAGKIYPLNYLGDEFLLPENFFDHFAELKTALKF